MRVVSFNIRYGSAPDGENAWPQRRGRFLEAVHALAPDLLGVQEPDREQWPELMASLGDGYAGLHAESLDPAHPDAHTKGIAFRRAAFEELAHGVFWISETPTVPESILQPNQWGQRTGAWVRLRDRATARVLTFVCTHFDTHPGCALRSAEIFGAETGKAAGTDPVIAVGDFNCPAGTPAWKHLTGPAGFRDAWRESGHADDGVISFNQFSPLARMPGPGAERRAYLEAKYGKDRFGKEYIERSLATGNERIDWILLRGDLRAAAAGVEAAARDGRCASDHFAVHADVAWTGK